MHARLREMVSEWRAGAPMSVLDAFPSATRALEPERARIIWTLLSVDPRERGTARACFD